MNSKENDCIVRPLQENEFQFMIDYFHHADESYLKSMGVDITKLKPKDIWLKDLLDESQKPYEEKRYFCLGWEYQGKLIGHSSLGQIQFGNEANIHLHIWIPEFRKGGLGQTFLKKSVDYYFKQFSLQKIFCEPYSKNPAPNKTLLKIGFELIQSYETIPHQICFKQVVNRYVIKNHLGKTT